MSLPRRSWSSLTTVCLLMPVALRLPAATQQMTLVRAHHKPRETTKVTCLFRLPHLVLFPFILFPLIHFVPLCSLFLDRSSRSAVARCTCACGYRACAHLGTITHAGAVTHSGNITHWGPLLTGDHCSLGTIAHLGDITYLGNITTLGTITLSGITTHLGTITHLVTIIHFRTITTPCG